ncbi:MAG: hypothetical protein RR400_00325 [Clostridia bacterium]
MINEIFKQGLAVLSSEENNKLALRAKEQFEKNGDLTLVQELIRHNLGLINYIMKSVQIVEKNIMAEDDAMSVGMGTILKCCIKFNGKIKFATFVTFCMKNDFFMEMRKHRTRYRTLEAVSLESPIAENLFLRDMIPDPKIFTDDFCYSYDNEVMLERMKVFLSMNDVTILKMLSEGFLQLDIAKKIDMERTKVLKTKDHAIDKIKKFVEVYCDIEKGNGKEILINNPKMNQDLLKENYYCGKYIITGQKVPIRHIYRQFNERNKQKAAKSLLIKQFNISSNDDQALQMIYDFIRMSDSTMLNIFEEKIKNNRSFKEISDMTGFAPIKIFNHDYKNFVEIYKLIDLKKLMANGMSLNRGIKKLDIVADKGLVGKILNEMWKIK